MPCLRNESVRYMTIVRISWREGRDGPACVWRGHVVGAVVLSGARWNAHGYLKGGAPVVGNFRTQHEAMVCVERWIGKQAAKISQAKRGYKESGRAAKGKEIVREQLVDLLKGGNEPANHPR